MNSFLILLVSDENLGVIFSLFIANPEATGADSKAEHREVWLFLDKVIISRIFMLLLMFSQIAHIKVLLVTSFYLTDILFPSLLILKMDLNVLLKVCGCCKGFTAFFTNKRLLLSVNPLVTIQIRFLVESLLTILKVTFVRLNTLMYEFMPLEGRFGLKGAIAIFVFTPKFLFIAFLVMARLYFDVIVLVAGHTVIVFLWRGILKLF